MTKVEPASFDVIKYKPGEEMLKLLEKLAKAANKLLTHVGEIESILNEIVKQGRKEGLLDMQIRELVDSFLGESRTIRKYLPKELKRHKYPQQRNRTEEIGTDSNFDNNNQIDQSSSIGLSEEIRESGSEPPIEEAREEDIETLQHKIYEQEQLIDELKKIVNDRDEQIAASEAKLRGLDQKIDKLSNQLKDQTDNLRERPEFKEATRQIEIAYEEQINHWRSECEKADRIHGTINFSPRELKCLDLIFKNQNGMLYLQHDGHKVIKVADIKPIEQGGEIVG